MIENMGQGLNTNTNYLNIQILQYKYEGEFTWVSTQTYFVAANARLALRFNLSLIPFAKLSFNPAAAYFVEYALFIHIYHSVL